MGFATCKEDAITLSGTIPDSQIVYGMYSPDTPKEDWDEQWERLYAPPILTHFWVETKEQIFDSGSEQFGLPPLVVKQKDDPHYFRIGVLNLTAGVLVPEKFDPVINWSTLTKMGGTVLIAWDEPPPFFKKMLGW